MRTRYLVAGLILCSSMSAAGAERALAPAIRRAGDPATIGEALRAMRERSQRVRSSARGEVIQVDARDSAFLIPIAGNTAGLNGTYFRSDVTLANYGTSDQRVGIGWVAAGQNNVNEPLVYFTLDAQTTYALQDFVGSQLGRSGLGAILVFGVDALNNDDSSAELDGASRIWTYQPGSAGTVSQGFDVVSLTDSLGSLKAYIVGLRQDGSFRTNVGVVNLDTVQHTWTVRSLFNSVSSTITVPPVSLVQTAVAPGSGSSTGNLALTIQSNDFGFWWSAYAGTTDNITGDGWAGRAKQ